MLQLILRQIKKSVIRKPRGTLRHVHIFLCLVDHVRPRKLLKHTYSALDIRTQLFYWYHSRRQQIFFETSATLAFLPCFSLSSCGFVGRLYSINIRLARLLPRKIYTQNNLPKLLNFLQSLRLLSV